jgi:hypothetical protein
MDVFESSASAVRLVDILPPFGAPRFPSPAAGVRWISAGPTPSTGRDSGALTGRLAGCRRGIAHGVMLEGWLRQLEPVGARFKLDA